LQDLLRWIHERDDLEEAFHTHAELLMLFVAQVIFDFRFLALLAIAGSLAGSLLCFLNVSHLGFLTVPWLLLILS
jgi:hypothetical protein